MEFFLVFLIKNIRFRDCYKCFAISLVFKKVLVLCWLGLLNVWVCLRSD